MVDISEGFYERSGAWRAQPVTEFVCPFDGSTLNAFSEESPDWSETTYEIECAACGTLFFVADGVVSYESEEADFDDADIGEPF
jgi:hypothetical protein